MRTNVLLIFVMFYSVAAYSQKFVYFDEFEKYLTKTEICLKEQKPADYSGSGKGGFIVIDNPGFFKKGSSELFKVFKKLTPEDQSVLERISVTLQISKNYKADYVRIVFDRTDRAYVLKNEKLFYNWVKSFENMNGYKACLLYQGTAAGGYMTFPVKSFFKEEYRE